MRLQKGKTGAPRDGCSQRRVLPETGAPRRCQDLGGLNYNLPGRQKSVATLGLGWLMRQPQWGSACTLFSASSLVLRWEEGQAEAFISHFEPHWDT